MAETKKKKKVTISEDDISLLLPRYSAATIVALLQEIAQFPDAKIDWNELVNKTCTGITNAREYQMLWRHLAYQAALLQTPNLDPTEPLDDDSDLDSDLEAYPPVSGEAVAEAAACAKVLLGSGLPNGSGPLNHATIEAPLTINIPTAHASKADLNNAQPACTQGKNITVPVSVQRLPLPTVTCTEGLEVNGSAAGGLSARRKRIAWTDEEDMELTAAVQKCGEKNWANILKGDFKGDRTTAQLAKRWSQLKKQRQSNLISSAPSNLTNAQLTEAQLATRRAVSHALNMPMMDNLLVTRSVGAAHSSIPSNSAAVPPGPEDISPGSQAQASHHKGTLDMASKSRVTTVTAKKGPSAPFKPFSGPNHMIQAAAVAAGARIATPSTAASLLKAAQSKKAVHIISGGGSMTNMPLPGVTKSLPTNPLGSHPAVHYVRTGLAPASVPPAYSGPSPSFPQPGNISLEHGNSTRPHMVTCSLPSSSTCTSTLPAPALCGILKDKVANATSTVATGLASKEDVKSEEMKEDGTKNVPEALSHGQAILPKVEASTEIQTPVMEDLKHPHNEDAGENKHALSVSKPYESSSVVKMEACSTAMDED